MVVGTQLCDTVGDAMNGVSEVSVVLEVKLVSVTGTLVCGLLV